MYRETRIEDLSLELGDIVSVDHVVVGGRYRILPGEYIVRNVGTDVASTRSHVTVRELEPGASKGLFELFRVVQEALRDFGVSRVFTKREVRREHDRSVTLTRHVCVGDDIGSGRILGNPLRGARRALRHLPFEGEEVLQVAHAPLYR